MKNLPKRSAAFGFTLLELLVVIAIIGILVTILTPTISSALARSHDVGCRSNLKQIHASMFMHVTQYEGKLPGGSYHSAAGPLNEERAWIGKEVLRPGERFSDYDPDNGWKPSTRPDNLGVLTDIHGIRSHTKAQKLYRCPAVEEGEPNSGIGSNGILDYTMPFIWAGADTENIPNECVIFRGSSNERRIPTPLLLEEDHNFYLNNNWREPGFNAGDRLGMHHESHGNYVSMDGGVHHLRWDGLGPYALQIEAQSFRGNWRRFGLYGYGGWNHQ